MNAHGLYIKELSGQDYLINIKSHVRSIYSIWIYWLGYLNLNMESEPARETVRTLPIYRGEERPDKGGETVWPGIIQLPLQADILREDPTK